MGNWHHIPTCADVALDYCQIEFDNQTGAFVRFVHKCSLHAAMAGPDTEVYRQVQIDSMRWAHARDVLDNKFPGAGRLSFNPATRALVLHVPAAAAANAQAIVTAAQGLVQSCVVMKRLLATQSVPASLLNLTIQTGA